MSHMKLAYSTLSCPMWSVEQAVEAVQPYGYDAIEWRMADGQIITPQTPVETIQRLIQASKQGLKVACLDTSCIVIQSTQEGRGQVIAEARAMVDLAVELAAPCLRLFMTAGFQAHNVSFAELIKPTTETLHSIVEYATSRGVMIALETHDEWSNSTCIALLQEAMRPARLYVIWDICHTYRMGERPEETLARLEQGSIAHVHIRDAYPTRGTDTSEGWQLCLLGEGKIPLRESLSLLQQVGYTGYLSVEWPKKWDPELAEPEVVLPQYAQQLRAY